MSSPSDERMVALGCLARIFIPNSFSFSWKLNNSTVSSERFWTFPTVLRDGLWSASSQVALSSSSAFQGPDDYLVCEVQHPKGGKTLGPVRVGPRASTPTPTTSVPSLISGSEGSNKAVSTQSSPAPATSHRQTEARTLACPKDPCRECQNHTQAPSVHLLPPKPAGPLAPGQGRVHLPGHGGGPTGCPLLLGGERAAPQRGLGGGTHLAHEQLLEPEQPPGPAQVPVGLRLQRHLHTEWPRPAVAGDPDGSERTCCLSARQSDPPHCDRAWPLLPCLAPVRGVRLLTRGHPPHVAGGPARSGAFPVCHGTHHGPGWARLIPHLECPACLQPPGPRGGHLHLCGQPRGLPDAPQWQLQAGHWWSGHLAALEPGREQRRRHGCGGCQPTLAHLPGPRPHHCGLRRLRHLHQGEVAPESRRRLHTDRTWPPPRLLLQRAEEPTLDPTLHTEALQPHTRSTTEPSPQTKRRASWCRQGAPGWPCSPRIGGLGCIHPPLPAHHLPHKELWSFLLPPISVPQPSDLPGESAQEAEGKHPSGSTHTGEAGRIRHTAGGCLGRKMPSRLR